MNSIPCANSSALRAYEAEQSRADERAEWIEKEAKAKLKAMKPYTPGDLDEAVSEVMADKSKNAAILLAFASGYDPAIGEAFQAAVDAYWLDYCTNQAADEYDDGAAELDYGRY